MCSSCTFSITLMEPDGLAVMKPMLSGKTWSIIRPCPKRHSKPCVLNPSQDGSDIIEVQTCMAHFVFSECCCQEFKYHDQ